jgi:hypothetical protein
MTGQSFVGKAEAALFAFSTQSQKREDETTSKAGREKSKQH